MIDIVLIGLILLLSFKGYFNGIVRELVGFVGLIGGVYVASRMADPAASFLRDTLSMGDNALLRLIAFVLVLGIVWGGSAFVATIFTALKTTPQSTLSKLLGMGVVGIKYFLIFGMLAAKLLNNAIILDNFSQKIHASRLLPILSHTGSVLINLVPPSLNTKPLIQTSSKKGRRG